MRTSTKKNFDVSAIDPRALLISKMGVFKHDPEFFKRIAIFFQFTQYEKGEIIIPGNQKIDKIGFVIKGSCNVTSILPFIAKRNYEKTILQPTAILAKSEFKQTETEKYVTAEVETQSTIHEGDWIPYIPVDKESVKNLTWKKENIYIYRYRNLCECQITAADQVIIASVPFEDFMSLAKESTIRVFIENPCVQRFLLPELQAQYLAQIAWDDHKKTIVDDLMEQKNLKKQAANNKF
jgi:hypothetical protein